MAISDRFAWLHRYGSWAVDTQELNARFQKFFEDVLAEQQRTLQQEATAMSSTYNLICASHDPALVIGEDYHEFNFPMEQAGTRNNRDALGEHAYCDLLVGRFSYPLIEVACPGGATCKPGFHSWQYDSWVKVGWLRLLYAVYTTNTTALGAYNIEKLAIPCCWTRTRVLRLGKLLEMPEREMNQ